MDTTGTLKAAQEARPTRLAEGTSKPRSAALAGWSLHGAMTWIAPLLGLALLLAASRTPVYLDEPLSGLVYVALAAAALAVAPRWPVAALIACLASSLLWLVPTLPPVAVSYDWLWYLTAVVAAMFVVALLTFVREPASAHRRLVILSGASACLAAGLLTVGATLGLQARALALGWGPVWASYGSSSMSEAAGTPLPTPVQALFTFGGPIFVAYLAGFAAAVVGGWVISLILAVRRGSLDDHPWLGRSRFVARIRRPRFALSLLIATGFAVYIGAAVVQNGSSVGSAALTGGALVPLALGAALAPVHPRVGVVCVGLGCLITAFAGFSQPWIAGWSAGSLVLAAVLAILIVLLALPSGRAWWWTAAALVVLGTTLFTPFTALQKNLDARSIAYAEASSQQRQSINEPDYPDEHAWATMGDEERLALEEKYGEIDRRAEEAATALVDEKVPGGPYGGPASIAAAFFQALPLFLLPAVLAWGLKLTASVAVERRRVAQARAELEASEKGRALQDERRGIAGDVHDVLAHSLTVIVAQGEGALVTRGAEQQDAVRRMVDVARASLRDVRALIERLDGEDTELPSPGLENLPALLQNVRDAGLSLTSEEFGERLPLGDSTELALYRILQEALTNVLSHGGRGATARLVLDWRGEEPGLSVTLASSGGDGSGVSHGNGLGIEGMRTRAAVAGGWLTAGPDDGRLGSEAHGPAAGTRLGDAPLGSQPHGPAAGTHLDDAPLGSGAQPAPGGPRPDDSAGAGRGWLVTAFLPAVAQSVGALR